MPFKNIPVGSAAWDIMNRRRWELIEKDVDHGLSEQERVELENLQQLSIAVVEDYIKKIKP